MINKHTTLKQLAFVVSDHLQGNGIHAVLSGGGAVSIYTDNKYQSSDLDFILPSGLNRIIEDTLAELGFYKDGRCFKHSQTEFFVEFPTGPLAIGSKLIFDWRTLTNESGLKLEILTPTQCVMDRLAAYFHWNDTQALEQALMVANDQDINLDEIKEWSREEESSNKFDLFKARLTS